MQAIMIFIDGVGLGENDARTNPFVQTSTPNISPLIGNKPLCLEASGYDGDKISLISLDATLGVPGIPQSATGQTALFTGENAPLIMGKHVNRYPHEPLKELLRKRGIFARLTQQNLKPAFINAYRPEFFADLHNGFTRPYSCSTFLNYYAGLSFRTLDELNEGKALYMDITNEFLDRMGYPVEIIKPEKAGERLVNISGSYDFILFEYFLSDLVGHQADLIEAGKIVKKLDRFLGSILQNVDEETLLIITSDHGNLEDASCSQHTLNPVFGLISGPRNWRDYIVEKLRDITGLADLFCRYLGVEEKT